MLSSSSSLFFWNFVSPCVVLSIFVFLSTSSTDCSYSEMSSSNFLVAVSPSFKSTSLKYYLYLVDIFSSFLCNASFLTLSFSIFTIFWLFIDIAFLELVLNYLFDLGRSFFFSVVTFALSSFIISSLINLSDKVTVWTPMYLPYFVSIILSSLTFIASIYFGVYDCTPSTVKWVWTGLLTVILFLCWKPADDRRVWACLGLLKFLRLTAIKTETMIIS